MQPKTTKYQHFFKYWICKKFGRNMNCRSPAIYCISSRSHHRLVEMHCWTGCGSRAIVCPPLIRCYLLLSIFSSSLFSKLRDLFVCSNITIQRCATIISVFWLFYLENDKKLLMSPIQPSNTRWENDRVYLLRPLSKFTSRSPSTFHSPEAVRSTRDMTELLSTERKIYEEE